MKWWVVVIIFMFFLGGGWWLGWWDFYGNFGGAKEVRERGLQALTGKSIFSVDKETPGYETFLKLTQGCPIRDCIPALVKPRMESIDKASEWLDDKDLVLGMDYKGEHRAYPVKILNWHEVVNDELKIDPIRQAQGKNGQLTIPIAITWSPLTGSAMAWSRQIDGKTLTLKISGRLFNSNTVMYDQETESLWQQITGEAIVGKLKGGKLEQIPVTVVTWGQWKGTHAATKVLSLETGYERDYSQHPYGTYETDTAMYFPIEGELDKTTDPKTVVYGIEKDGLAKAYTLAAIERETNEDSVLPDRIGDRRIRLSYNHGELFVEDLSTKGKIMPARMYWFAWRAFYPKSEIYQ